MEGEAVQASEDAAPEASSDEESDQNEVIVDQSSFHCVDLSM